MKEEERDAMEKDKEKKESEVTKTSMSERNIPDDTELDLEKPLPLSCVWHFTAQPWQPHSHDVLDMYKCDTVQNMWRFLNQWPVTKYIDTTPHYSMSMFREGIPAEWEHERNASGGNLFWKQDLVHADIDLAWQVFVLFAAGNNSTFRNAVNGVRCIVKEGRPRFELWFGQATNAEVNVIATDLKAYIADGARMSVAPDFEIFGVRGHPRAEAFDLEGHAAIKAPPHAKAASSSYRNRQRQGAPRGGAGGGGGSGRGGGRGRGRGHSNYW